MDLLKEKIKYMENLIERCHRAQEFDDHVRYELLTRLEEIKDAAMRVDCIENEW